LKRDRMDGDGKESEGKLGCLQKRKRRDMLEKN
jgi:hypothetical protein